MDQAQEMELLNDVTQSEYKYGFTDNYEADEAPKGSGRKHS